MNSKIEKLSSLLNELGLSKEAEEASMLLGSEQDELPTRFPLAFRYWIRDSYYKHNVNQTYSPKWKGIIANSLFKKETNHTKMKIYKAWTLIRDARADKREEPSTPSLYTDKAEVDKAKSRGAQLDLFGDSGSI